MIATLKKPWNYQKVAEVLMAPLINKRGYLKILSKSELVKGEPLIHISENFS